MVEFGGCVMSYVFQDARAVRSQIVSLISIYPELAEDAELLADTVEGETDFERVAEKVLDFIRDAETLAAAVKARKDDIAERQKRYERQADSGRKVMLSLLKAARMDRVTLAEATISIT